LSLDHAVLECQRIKQRYKKPGRGFQVVLNDLDFTVPVHEFVSVVGPSGCGKSTLLRMILGSEVPWQGTISCMGQPVVHPDRSRGIVFQRYSLFPHLTVLENVLFGLELDGSWLLQRWLTWPWYKRTHHKRYAEQAMTYLRAVRLDEHADKYPAQLSGGMQQRVAIAQAMILKPSILLMDEPFGALDPGTREALQLTMMETFQSQPITIFFVTHDLEEACFVGNRLLVLTPFYVSESDAPAQGAKIVMDVPTPKGTTTLAKQTPEFQALVARVRLCGFDPKHALKESEFDHSARQRA
jgi:NitT/TauT family transport system ATP-binding protein